MNASNINVGGWSASCLSTYINNGIYSKSHLIKLKNNIIRIFAMYISSFLCCLKIFFICLYYFFVPQLYCKKNMFMI